MVAFEKELMANSTDLVMLVGDVTSTIACSIVAKKLNAKVVYVEAGIRTFDLGMPEETNRMVTDSITDYFFTTTTWSGCNLLKVGLKIVHFSIHPRTAAIFKNLGIGTENLHIIDPLGYLELNHLVEGAKAVIRDSGGITEEAPVMGVPCITLRDNTERHETEEIGTSEFICINPQAIQPAMHELWEDRWKKGGIPEKWDARSAERIVKNSFYLYG